MGRESGHIYEEGKGARMFENVLLGTDLGNVRGGMENSILIGTNLYNHNPSDRKDAKYDERGMIKDIGMQRSMQGQFAIGHNNAPLLHGNLLTNTLNTAPLRSLVDTLAAIEAGPTSASAENVLFLNDNIVLSNADDKIDGVQLIKDRLTEVEKLVCVNDFKLTCIINHGFVAGSNGTVQECLDSYNPVINCRPPVTAILTVSGINAGMFPSENGYRVEMYKDGAWVEIASSGPGGNGRTSLDWVATSVGVEDVTLTFIDSPSVILTQYRITLTDSYGDGWQVNGLYTSTIQVDAGALVTIVSTAGFTEYSQTGTADLRE
jgi:hypothetical protein